MQLNAKVTSRSFLFLADSFLGYSKMNFTLLMLSAASTAYAGPTPGAPVPLPAPVESREVTWDELKARCANPKGFPTQHAPEQIRVQCTETRREYLPENPGVVRLPAARTVTTALVSDKYSVSSVSKDFPIESKSGSCLRFREVEYTGTIERVLSCAEIVNVKGDLQDFCGSALELHHDGKYPGKIPPKMAGNTDPATAGKPHWGGKFPKGVQIRETENRIDTCPMAEGPGRDHGGDKDGGHGGVKPHEGARRVSTL